LLAAALVLALLFIVACNAIVLRSAAGKTYRDVAAVPVRPYAMVFGAGLDPDQTPSAMLADRLDAGIALLRAHKVQRLLFTGDNGTVEHNELRAMLLYALARGVRRSQIVLDYAGFSTRDSCYRAPHVFGVRSAVLVTQAYHVPRAIFLCAGQGMDVVGFAVQDWGRNGTALMLEEGVAREALARVKAVLKP